MSANIPTTHGRSQPSGTNKPVTGSQNTLPEPSEDGYSIGWICALKEEYAAAHAMLDFVFSGPGTSKKRDSNLYAFGKIYGHNVVITCLPDGEYGTNCAASVAKDMIRSFPALRFTLMVGIGKGAPIRENDVRLGDVVVSTPQGTLGGVVQLDFVKRLRIEGRAYDQRIGFLSPPPRVLRAAQQEVRRHYDDPGLPDRVAANLERMTRQDFKRPAQDRLYRAEYEHEGGPNCDNCNPDKLEDWNQQPRLTNRVVGVPYGMIGSSNSLIERTEEREMYARDPDLKIFCFETEAAGLMNTYPCLVIRGICDYSADQIHTKTTTGINMQHFQRPRIRGNY
ncbi:hypothetical protein TWF106_002577 [Orbilia oligospora]|uniref:Nucleoside phosphorylase domain-containing protein n=2 Tax=Orbilia oligospora TaxID=2813651 RepID=A0A7C8UXU6_ORBOL|nr:hypothetical protein TWF106_002577 [Orbilia oligospora]